MVKHIYLLPSLGADKRLFQKIQLPEVEFHNIVYPIPEPNESIQSFCQRLAEQIAHPNPILVGSSIGGVLSIELSKLIATDKIILLASIKTAKELPAYFRAVRIMRLYDWFPMSEFKARANLGSFKGDPNDQSNNLFLEMLRDTDDRMLLWGFKQVSIWKNKEIPSNLVHIHGDKDTVFPIKNVKADYVIEGGYHFLAYDSASEINALLQQIVWGDLNANV